MPNKELILAYQQMAADLTQEQEAEEWIESLLSDATFLHSKY